MPLRPCFRAFRASARESRYMTRLFDCSLRLLVRPQGLPGGLLHVLFHHGDRFFELLTRVRSTRAALTAYADARTLRARADGTARRKPGVHDHVHGEYASDSESDEDDEPPPSLDEGSGTSLAQHEKKAQAAKTDSQCVLACKQQWIGGCHRRREYHSTEEVSNIALMQQCACMCMGVPTQAALCRQELP